MSKSKSHVEMKLDRICWKEGGQWTDLFYAFVQQWTGKYRLFYFTYHSILIVVFVNAATNKISRYSPGVRG